MIYMLLLITNISFIITSAEYSHRRYLLSFLYAPFSCFFAYLQLQFLFSSCLSFLDTNHFGNPEVNVGKYFLS